MNIVHQGNPPDAAAFATTQHCVSAGATHPSSIDIERILRADRTAGSHPVSTTDWKLVAEGLPDDDILVLIALNDDDVWTGYRDGDIWRYVDAMPIASERVTHWMPLPAHPGAA
jgi:hypothetical protein